jgi:hypothetical protein
LASRAFGQGVHADAARNGLIEASPLAMAANRAPWSSFYPLPKIRKNVQETYAQREHIGQQRERNVSGDALRRHAAYGLGERAGRQPGDRGL